MVETVILLIVCLLPLPLLVGWLFDRWLGGNA